MNSDTPPTFSPHATAEARPSQPDLNDFRRARHQAIIESLVNRLKGKSIDLLPYDTIAEMLRVHGRAERGVQSIPLASIVGSVGRYNDFTRSFLPKHDWDAQRWLNVRRAGQMSDLPPIDVYKIDQVYFVLDGNHRVSIARQLGLEHIRANVIELHSRVPLTPDIKPDELIIKAEYAAFLHHTQLDELRPGCDLQVTVPGQYAHLENHLEVYRFIIETAEGCELDDPTAVTRWYDEAYWPLVSAIREHGLLHDFPNRTETDLYLWLATYQAQLRHKLGWAIRPDTAVTHLGREFKPKPLLRKMLEVVVPSSFKTQTRTSWTEEKLIDRYSQSLFTEILLPLFPETQANATAVLQQASHIAHKENGRLVGLFLGAEDDANARHGFDAHCAQIGIASIWVNTPTSPADSIANRALWTDLVMLSQADAQHTAVHSFLQAAPHPVWIVGQAAHLPQQTLLCYQPQQKCSLFVAAYLAEQWQTQLTIQAPTAVRQQLQDYLQFHDITATFIDENLPIEPTSYDLLIVGQQAPQLTAFWQHPRADLLICPQ